MSSRFHLELGVTNVFGGVWPTGLFAYSNTCMRFTMYVYNLTRLGISAFIWGHRHLAMDKQSFLVTQLKKKE